MSTRNEIPFFQIADDVRAELEDPKFLTRQHYSRATYAKGCHGPLCKLAETHRGRVRNQDRAVGALREYRPNLDARKTDREAELMPIVEWHLRSRSGEMSEVKAS